MTGMSRWRCWHILAYVLVASDHTPYGCLHPSHAGVQIQVPAPEPDDGRALMPVRVRMERCQVKGFGQSALHILSPAAVVDVVKCLIEVRVTCTMPMLSDTHPAW